MKNLISLTVALCGLSAIRLAAQIDVASGGNVGVGTASPGNKFTVEGTGDVAAVGSSTKKFYFAPDSSGVGLFTGAGKTGNGLYADITNNAVVVSTNSAERFRIDSSGKMGLGTNSPSFPFSLGTSLGSKLALYDAGGGAGYGFGVQSNLLQIFASTSSDRVGIGFGNSGSFSEALTVKGWNVGIGTTSPASQLHIYGGNPGTMGPYYSYQIRADTSGNTGLLFSTPTANAAYIYHNTPLDGASAGIKFDGTSRYISFFTVNGAERMRIDNVGNVGIGTTSPTQKLEVAGSVRATSFISNSTTYADFVFEPGYKLPALSEVEAHIKELGRLPGIPSEAEAKERGIDLASMQVKLLQKIEELTLHQIAQEKQLSAQSVRIERLEFENTRLRDSAHR